MITQKEKHELSKKCREDLIAVEMQLMELEAERKRKQLIYKHAVSYERITCDHSKVNPELLYGYCPDCWLDNI